MSKSRLSTLERSFQSACNQARNAFRSKKLPERPVIMFGKKGFFFGDETNRRDCAFPVCTYLDEFEGVPSGKKTEELPLPSFDEVMEHIYGSFESKVGGNAASVWKKAKTAAGRTGDFSALIDPSKLKTNKRKHPQGKTARSKSR